MKNIVLSLFAATFITVSCKKDERPTYLKDEGAASAPTVAMNTAPKASLIDQAGIKTTNVQTGSSMVTAPGMNPPHGQPGHRCDIPVGQPLSSSPTSANKNANQPINVNANNTIQIDPNTINQTKSAPVKTAPGMNPPHGQPGHRCDIPVGQPLNSKPAPASQPVAQNSAPMQAPQPVQAPQPAPTGPKPAVNPPHGQPWHDCAKKVGDPL